MNPLNARRFPLLSRRQALGRLGGLGAVLALPRLVPAAPPAAPAPTTPAPTTQPTGADALRPAIRPRADWAGDLTPTGPLEPEEEVRFLLVHHTASTNDYGPDEVAGQIRDFYQFHTGAEKGWPDVAYNFFVDRYGGIWEGRQGSAAGPVRADATGGSQGYAQLCSLIGNHQDAPVTPEQQASLTQLLAWLGQTYAIDTTPGATVTFVSRGSNRWPAGQEVTTRTIAGHRDMSMTSCPGDLAYALIDQELPTAVTALRTVAATTTTTTTSTTTVASATATATSANPTTPAPTTNSLPTVENSLGHEVAGAEVGGVEVSGPGGGGATTTRYLVGGGAAAGALAVMAGLVTRLRRRADRYDQWDPPDDGWAADDDG